MLNNELQKIVDTIATKHTLFTDRGFLKNERVAGGFVGITNEYENYFFASTDLSDIEKYKFDNDFEDGCDVVSLSFDFELIFQTKCAIDNFLEVIIHGLLNEVSIEIISASDETETIYNQQTGQSLGDDTFQLYRIECRFNSKYDLGNYISCLTETCFDANCCDTIN